MDWNKILQVKNVTKNYGEGRNRTAALRGISFDVLEESFLGSWGDSGSGKTTLLNCIATILDQAHVRKILLNGEDISAFKGSQACKIQGRKIGYLYPEFELLDNLTAREYRAAVGASWNHAKAGAGESYGTGGPVGHCSSAGPVPSQMSEDEAARGGCQSADHAAGDPAGG